MINSLVLLGGSAMGKYALYGLLVVGQILSAGNLNYQQDIGLYEINPLYGRHPSTERVYFTKVIETIAIIGIAKAMPKHEMKILTGANMVCWGFIAYDRVIGIKFGFRW